MAFLDHSIETIIICDIQEQTLHQEHVVDVRQLDNHRSHVHVNLHLCIEIEGRMHDSILLSHSKHFDSNVQIER